MTSPLQGGGRQFESAQAHLIKMAVTTYDIKNKKVPERRKTILEVLEKKLEVIVIESVSERFTRGHITESLEDFYIVQTDKGEKRKIEYKNMKILYSTDKE